VSDLGHDEHGSDHEAVAVNAAAELGGVPLSDMDWHLKLSGGGTFDSTNTDLPKVGGGASAG